MHLVATDVTSVIMKNFFSVVKYHSIYFLLVKHSHVFILKIALTISLLYYVVILFYKRSILCMNSMLSELIGRFSSYLLNFSALIVAKWQYPHPTPPIPPHPLPRYLKMTLNFNFRGRSLGRQIVATAVS